MSPQGYVGIDRRLGLLVVLEALHRISYKEIDKTLLAAMVKNSSLINWYPENRELPDDDPYRSINPWIDEMFLTDFPELVRKGFAEEYAHHLRLTDKGRSLAGELLGLPQYLKLKDEIRVLYRKYGIGTQLEWFKKRLIANSKSIPFDRESCLYDSLSFTERLPIGVTIEPEGITPQLDLKALFGAFKARIERTQVLRAPHEETQLHFLRTICDEYANSPLGERPLVEICGQCSDVEVIDGSALFGFRVSRFSVLVKGGTVLVVTKGFSIEPSNIRFHSLRVQGFPYFKHGVVEIEATRIFDKGKSYPSNSKAF